MSESREVEAQPLLFPEPEDILCSLRKVEKYVHDVIEDWEKHGQSIGVGANNQNLGNLKNLAVFLDSSKKGFRDNAAEPMEKLVKAVRAQLLS